MWLVAEALEVALLGASRVVRAEAVHANDLSPLVDEPLAEVRAEKAGASGDECLLACARCHSLPPPNVTGVAGRRSFASRRPRRRPAKAGRPERAPSSSTWRVTPSCGKLAHATCSSASPTMCRRRRSTAEGSNRLRSKTPTSSTPQPNRLRALLSVSRND